MSLFDRYIEHEPSSASAPTGLPSAPNPLGAGRMTVWASNATRVLEQNQVRVLRQHAGVRGFYAQALPSTLTSAPDPAQIPWTGTVKDGQCAVDLGTHWVWRRPDGRWPRLRFTFTASVEGANVLGWCLAIAPGLGGPLDAVAVLQGTRTSFTWTELGGTIDLDGERDTRPLTVSPTNGILLDVAERGEVRAFRAFFGAYNSSGVNAAGSLAYAVGLSLVAEAP